jgi:hypothetical protein
LKLNKIKSSSAGNPESSRSLCRRGFAAYAWQAKLTLAQFCPAAGADLTANQALFGGPACEGRTHAASVEEASRFALLSREQRDGGWLLCSGCGRRPSTRVLTLSSTDRWSDACHVRGARMAAIRGVAAAQCEGAGSCSRERPLLLRSNVQYGPEADRPELCLLTTSSLGFSKKEMAWPPPKFKSPSSNQK